MITCIPSSQFEHWLDLMGESVRILSNGVYMVWAELVVTVWVPQFNGTYCSLPWIGV